MKKIQLDQFHYHEALDRIFLVGQILSDFVVDHPAVKQNPEVKALVESAAQGLADAYQKIGALKP